MILYELCEKVRIISIKSKMEAVLWFRYGQTRRGCKEFSKGFQINNDGNVQAKHSLWVIIMAVSCVVLANYKTSSRANPMRKSWVVCDIRETGKVVDSSTITITSNTYFLLPF